MVRERVFGVGHFDLLRSEHFGQRLQVQLLANRYNRNREPKPIYLREEGLEYDSWVQFKGLGSLSAIALNRRIMLVAQDLVRNPPLLEQHNRRGHT